MSLLNKVASLARSPHGRKLAQDAMRYAKSPEGKRRVADARSKLANVRRPPR